MPLFLQLKFCKRDIYKNLEHLSYQTYSCVYPFVGVEHFGWMKNILLGTPSVGAADICAVFVILILRA
jgi:hypothetical protein